jgi:hypothetical protein
MMKKCSSAPTGVDNTFPVAVVRRVQHVTAGADPMPPGRSSEYKLEVQSERQLDLALGA